MMGLTSHDSLHDFAEEEPSKPEIIKDVPGAAAKFQER